MPLPVSYYGITIADNTKKNANGEPETTSFQVPVAELTSANVDAQITGLNALEAAIDAIIIGNMLQHTVIFEKETLGVGIAASTLAQRENKWLLRYHDAITYQKFQVSIGTADLTLLPSGSEFLNLAAGVGLTLKNTFEASVRSPADSSNAVILDSVQFVGRNN